MEDTSIEVSAVLDTMLFEIVHCVLDSKNPACVLIGYFQLAVGGGEFLLESHYELHQVQRVSTQIFYEGGFGSCCLLFDAKLFYYYCLDSLVYCGDLWPPFRPGQ